jgi:hypothetical protein
MFHTFGGSWADAPSGTCGVIEVSQSEFRMEVEL